MSTRLHRKFVPWLLHHSVEFGWYYLGAFFCLYVLQVFQSEIPQKIRTIVRDLNGSELDGLSVWVFLGLALGILFFRTLSRLLFFYPARVQQKFLRVELMNLLESSPVERYRHKSQGQIFQIIFDDINNLRAFVGFGLLQIGNLIIAGIVLVPRLNSTDPYLWPAFIPLFLSVPLFSIITFINQRYFKKMMDKKGDVQQFIIESYEAKQTIKNFHKEENFVQGFVKNSTDELLLFFKSSIGFAISGPYVKLSLGVSLIWAAFLIRSKGGDSSDLVFFSGFLYLFLEPVMFMSWVAVVISQGGAAWKRVKELYNSLVQPTESELNLAGSLVDMNSEQLKFQFDFWNKQINLNFTKKCWSILIGETGSGKSSVLFKIASSLKIKNMKVSMVQQEPYLFNDTVMENIFLGRDVNDDELKDVVELIKVFQLDTLSDNIDSVLHLEVGENGKRLSGGQIKRIALIRSLLSGAEVFVWDDPFSSIDIILEKKIIRILKSSIRWNNATFIISGHRLTTARLCDEIILIERFEGVVANGVTEKTLKDVRVSDFFKKQMVEISLS